MKANTSTRYNRFLLLGNAAVKEPAPLVAGAKALAFFHYLGNKYRFQRTGENVPLYFRHSRSDSLALSLEYSLYFWRQTNRFGGQQAEWTQWGQTRAQYGQTRAQYGQTHRKLSQN